MPAPRFKRNLALFGVCCIVALAAAGSQAQAQATPFEIPVILSITGPGAFLGKTESQSLGVVEQYVNKNGGIKGRPVKFTIADDQSTPSVAVQLFNAAIAKHASVVIGSSIAASCNAMASVISNGPVVYCVSGGVEPPQGGFMFALGSGNTIAVPVGIRYFRERGLKKLAILSSTDASGMDGARLVDNAVALPENKDVQVVDREFFNPGDVSIAAQVAKIKASGAQVITLWALGTNAGTAFRGLQDGGVDLPVFSTGANAIHSQLRQYAASLPKELLFGLGPTMVYNDLSPGLTKTAVGMFQTIFNSAGIELDVTLATGYDPGPIVVDTLRALGTGATPAQIRDHINGIHGWAGAFGEYDFREKPQLGLGQNTILVTRWDPARSSFVAVSKFGGTPR